MQWYYAAGQQQCGPIEEAQLEELIRSGTITADTLVWRNGMAEWQPLQTVGGFGSPPTPMTGGVGTATCAECRQVFAQSEMVRLNQSWVCAGCKPIFLQRLAEGAAPSSFGAVWRSGKQMVLRAETPLPDNCIRCNAPVSGYRLKRTLYWHSPYWYLLILVSLLIYVIVALCIRKKAIIHIGLCDRHRKERGWFIAGAWLAVLSSIAMVVAGVSNGSGGLILGGIVLFIVAAVVGVMKGGVVTAAKIDDGVAWVKGAGPAFLANLPEWTGMN
jgi:hypothetical protein